MSINSEEEFIDFVKKVEKEAEENPRGYTTKLALFALLGYAVIFLLLFTLIGLAGGLVATAFFSTALFLLLLKKKILFVLLFGIWMLVRALWIKFTPPQGYVLKRKEYPELFGEIDSLTKQLKALKIHEVILERNLNAAVVQHPRLGILGWHKNYLIIGYQLLLTLSPDEMKSVLAHEMGHLSGNHSRFSGWIYRVRLTWGRVMNALSQSDSWGGALMARFFSWYSPKFEAYSFALARRNEYEADAIAAELTSPEVASRALVSVYASAPYIDQRYWENYVAFADTHETPPHAPFDGLSRFLVDNPMAREEMLERVKSEMEVETHYADTHPSLKDRVNAIGARPQLPSAPVTSAAVAWLGTRNDQIKERFDQEWLAENADSWSNRYRYVSDANASLSRYKNTEISELNDEELWNFAYWTQEFETREEALSIFNAFQERYPQDPDCAFYIGLTLLSQENEDGLKQLEIAQNNPRLVEQTAYAGFEFLSNQGKEDEAQQWWKVAVHKNQVNIEAHRERQTATVKDRYLCPDIPDHLMKEVLDTLGQHKRVAKIWIAQKEVMHFPERPVYILAYSLKKLKLPFGKASASIENNFQFDEDCFIICKNGDGKALAKKVIKAGKRVK